MATENTMQNLSTLTPAELIFLQKHIELGKEHLIHLLGKKGFQELLELERTKNDRLKKVKTDQSETTGNLILAVNTAITGSFGGWLGLCAMLELKLGTFLAFYSILFLATLFGSLVGYLSFRQTKNKAKVAIESLQLLQLTGAILAEIEVKRTQEVESIELQIQSHFLQLYSLKDISILKGEFKDWEQTLENGLFPYKKSPFYPLFQEKMTTLNAAVQKAFDQSAVPSALYSEEEKRELPLLFQKLVRAPLLLRNAISAGRFSTSNLIVSLIPTLLGGFGSLFVYLKGSIDIARAFEQNQFVAFFGTLEAKIVKLFIALVVTIYFGFTVFHSQKKEQNRKLEIEKAKKTLTQQEAALTFLDTKLLKLRKLKEEADKVVEIFHYL